MILFRLFLATSAFVLQLWLFPSFLLLVFAPLCIYILQTRGRIKGIWTAALCGMVYDFTLFDSPFGFYSLIYALALGGVSVIRKPLFSRNLPLLNGAFSTFYWILSLPFFHGQLSISGAAVRLALFPLTDTLYAFFWFTCPFILYNRVNGTAQHHL
jgi:hypothetical protein